LQVDDVHLLDVDELVDEFVHKSHSPSGRPRL